MKKIAVYTSGGDAPGMNACIRAVVRTAIFSEVQIYGIRRGYNGMIRGDVFPMHSRSVSNILQRGGTILKSARSMEFQTPEGRRKAYENLAMHGIEGMIAIGGNGTFTGAKIFCEEYGIPTIGVPGTIDNDLYGTDYTIGFDTAVNTSLDAIDKIRDTADAHDRIFFIEVMGRDSGYIAVQSGLGGGAELIMVPETTTTTKEVIEVLTRNWERSKTSCIVIIAEGDEEGNADEIAAKVKGRIPYSDIKVTRLGHVQRGGKPTAMDRMLATRLGMSAVEALLNGHQNEMVGIVNNELAFTPFGDAIDKPKPIHPDLLRIVGMMNV